jgi:hypothetical protein
MTARRVVVAAATAVVACAGVAGAHSASDFMKVPVGKAAAVLLPPALVGAGPAQIVLTAPAGFELRSVDAGAGWRSAVAPTEATVTADGRHANLAVVTVTGLARTAGRFPIRVHVTTMTGTADTTDVVTAGVGYQRPTDSAGAARPDAAVAIDKGRTTVPWTLSALLAAAAIALLLWPKLHLRELLGSGVRGREHE